MAPAAKMQQVDNTLDELEVPVLEMASAEIERIREAGTKGCYHSFPPACIALLRSLDGNNRCVDCGAHNPQWGSVKFGALLCLNCSGVHRSWGVNVSCVRSITMDDWSLEEIISMLEGGNGQLAGFFSRNALTVEGVSKNPSSSPINASNVIHLRYKTKAARFYKQKMESHVEEIIKAGPYRGRENAREMVKQRRRQQKSQTSTNYCSNRTQSV